MSQAAFAPHLFSSSREASLLQRLQSSARHFAQSERVTKIRDHKLTQTFMNAAQKSGLKTAFKLAAAGTAGALGANAYGVALAGGAGVTFAEAIRDYAAWRKEQENKSQGLWGMVKNFFSFLGDNKAKYTGKLLKNTGIGFLGAEIGSVFAGRETVTEKLASHIPGLSTLGEKAAKFGDFITDKIFPAAHAGELSKAVMKRINESADPLEALLKEKGLMPSKPPRVRMTFAPPAAAVVDAPSVPEAAAAPAPAPVPAPAVFDLAKLDTKGWDAKALEDLKAAKAGKSWALQNIAHYAANGLHGMNTNFEMAREFAQQAGAKGSKLSAKFLSDLDALGAVKKGARAAIEGIRETAVPVVAAPSVPPDALAEVLAKPDSNVCHYTRSVTEKIEGLSHNAFKIACDNPETLIQPTDHVRLNFDNGHSMKALNNTGAPLKVREMQKMLADTAWENPDLDKLPISRAARVAGEGIAEPSL